MSPKTKPPSTQPEGAGYTTRDAAKSGLIATLVDLGIWGDSCTLESLGTIGIAEDIKPTHTGWKFRLKRGKDKTTWVFTAYGESWELRS